MEGRTNKKRSDDRAVEPKWEENRDRRVGQIKQQQEMEDGNEKK